MPRRKSNASNDLPYVRRVPGAHVPVVPKSRTSLLDLGELMRLRDLVIEQMPRAVQAARFAGHSWRDIAGALGQPAASVHRRYRWVDDTTMTIVATGSGAGRHARCVVEATGLEIDRQGLAIEPVRTLDALRDLRPALTRFFALGGATG